MVNGPEIFSKYVGGSEENIRNLFADAKAEMEEKGDESELHVIILDEVDAICRQRGTTRGDTGVGDRCPPPPPQPPAILATQETVAARSRIGECRT